MAEKHADIVIFGAGIAGLWAFHHFKSLGYNALLLESTAIGSGQTIASQGILHSGLKYAFAGKINSLAANISAMPDRWRAALNRQGPVDLASARLHAPSQYLLIPSGLMGGLLGLVTRQVLGEQVHTLPKTDWPDSIQGAGFKGALVHMNEPVLDIPSVLQALALPYIDSIRRIDTPEDPLGFLAQNNIHAKILIFTSAGSNARIACRYGHDAGLETQTRPLLMGMIKPAPFPLYAHCVGPSDKPVITITTHTAHDGTLLWYCGGAVAEREKESDPTLVFKAIRQACATYFPALDLKNLSWASLPIDRIEGRSRTDGWLPDTPTIHQHENHLYCWPTKLTFAPLLTERLLERITISPSCTTTDWSFLPELPFVLPPWETVQWHSTH